MTEGNKILNKKVFCKTSDGYGFAPVQIDENKWVVMMFESEEKFNNNQPVNDFLFEHDEFNDFKTCWIISTRFKKTIELINSEIHQWNKKKINTKTRTKRWYEWGRLD